ncbi:DNA glycosylase/AP lyase ROS1-like isoform X2 [Andrographis paniculata]|uniref:DNA glycosylase/AP lyase ROS1-like isoform X2 n=1 Tax=Andrographis paniculata TaxID=175694 RepID=UPI0021E90B4B|nr:DNA glycosylase/AP lyase ROS1-like isoform X2 [Andrographis paniculata]
MEIGSKETSGFTQLEDWGRGSQFEGFESLPTKVAPAPATATDCANPGDSMDKEADKNFTSMNKNQKKKKKKIREAMPPRKRMKMKKHRPKVFDETKPKPSKPRSQTQTKKTRPLASTPKPKTPRPVKKNNVGGGDHITSSKKRKLNFNVDENLKACDGNEVGFKKDGLNVSVEKKAEVDTKPQEDCITEEDQNSMEESNGIMRSEPESAKLQSNDKSKIKVYRRILRTNGCLKSIRKIGPNCPYVYKRKRSMRKRAAVVDKFVMFVGKISRAQRQRSKKKQVGSEFIEKSLMKSLNLRSQGKNSLIECNADFGREEITASTQAQMDSDIIKKKSLDFSSQVGFEREEIIAPSQEQKSLTCSAKGVNIIEFYPNLSSQVDFEREEITTSAQRQKNIICLDATVNFIKRKRSNTSSRRKDLSSIKLFATKQSKNCLLGVTKIGSNGIRVTHKAQKRSSKVANVKVVIKSPLRGVDFFTSVVIESFIEELAKKIKSLRIGDSNHQFEWRRTKPLHNACNQLVVRDHSNQNASVTPTRKSKELALVASKQISSELALVTSKEKSSELALVTSKQKSDSKKPKQPQPKVDLDLETMRVWNQLIENGSSEDTGPGPSNSDREEYWRQQREIFRGRVDSFIARMHLILGNRRFSPWKGSVVDSVVGVYLTQNVSDQLSSSAFMNLAAKYPAPIVDMNGGSNDTNDYIVDQIEHVELAESSSTKCGELCVIEKHLSSNPMNEVEFEQGARAISVQPMSVKAKAKENATQETEINWDELRTKYSSGRSKKRTYYDRDSVDWEAVRRAPVEEVAKVITGRGMNNVLALRIKDFLNRLAKDHGSIDLEWLRDVPPDEAKKYLLSYTGIGLKSVECVRLLCLRHHAFPVDTNVARILVRLGWVPLKPLPGDIQIHLLNDYPPMDTIQQYIWPRVCNRTQLILYEYHYQMITFGKIFCTKRLPNCNACPMKGECRHFASAYASGNLRLENSKGKNSDTKSSVAPDSKPMEHTNLEMISEVNGDFPRVAHQCHTSNCEPIVELPASPERELTETLLERDIEDFGYESDDEEIPTVKLNDRVFLENTSAVMDDEDANVSKELATLCPEFASIPMPKLKYANRLRTVHHVYELPDSHPILARFEKREPDDPCPYLLAIWTPEDLMNSSQPQSSSQNSNGDPCTGEIVQYNNDRVVHGTILIPCRTANRGYFPLNGTYFQTNEVFADYESSRVPLVIPRESIWNLRRRALYCGTSATTICRGMPMEWIVCLFRSGFICIRGFDTAERAPKPLYRRFHVCKTRKIDED